MSSAGSVTRWIDDAKAGDRGAVEQLCRRYFDQMVGLARKKLRGARRRVADEEDVALGAFDSFYRGLAKGRFPKLQDRNDLWGLLIVITVRQAIDLMQRERREAPAGESVDIEQVIGSEPAPEIVTQMAEQCRRLLDRLGDDRLRTIAQCKLEGFTNAEIAAKVDCSVRTIEQKLRAIRLVWSEESPK
jgi:DNA-directed RNA polymerase specialized sigma24 family protein